MLRAGTAVLVAILGAVGAADGAEPPVELVAPADGATWVAGTTAVLEWRAVGELGAGVEEWEAFLSVDGGKYYAVRLTPHLDVARRRIAVEVPNLPSANARLLLRFGDERVEVAVEPPVRLRIEPARFALGSSAVPALTTGEAARAGDRGVLAWVAGGRDGSGLRRYRGAETPGAEPAELWALAATLTGAVPPDPQRALLVGAALATERRAATASTVDAPAPTVVADSLLLTGRRNE